MNEIKIKKFFFSATLSVLENSLFRYDRIFDTFQAIIDYFLNKMSQIC